MKRIILQKKRCRAELRLLSSFNQLFIQQENCQEKEEQRGFFIFTAFLFL